MALKRLMPGEVGHMLFIHTTQKRLLQPQSGSIASIEMKTCKGISLRSR